MFSFPYIKAENLRDDALLQKAQAQITFLQNLVLYERPWYSDFVLSSLRWTQQYFDSGKIALA